MFEQDEICRLDAKKETVPLRIGNSLFLDVK